MRGLTSALIFLQLVGASFAALSEWRTESVHLCDGPLRLSCGATAELVIGRASYRSADCTCPSCEGLGSASALEKVVKECSGRRYCQVADLLPFAGVSCECHKKILELKYACVPFYRTQKACGEEPFKFRDRGIVSNALFPASNELRRCGLIFKVGSKKAVSVCPLTVDLPAGWTTVFCNMSGCVTVTNEPLTLEGNSHVRMVQDSEEAGEAANITFAFEYEVVNIAKPVVPQRKADIPDFDPSEVGVIKLEKKTRTAAIAAGVTIPLALIAIFGGVWIYKIKNPDEKEVDSDPDSTCPRARDLYYKDVLRHRNSRVLTNLQDGGTIGSVNA